MDFKSLLIHVIWSTKITAESHNIKVEIRKSILSLTDNYINKYQHFVNYNMTVNLYTQEISAYDPHSKYNEVI